MRILSRNLFTMFAVMVMALFTLFPEDADARRMGGGRSFGRQSENVTQRRAPERSAQQTNTAPSQQTPNKRSGIGGILGGLAAGLGLAALFSYLGLGEGLANMLGSVMMIALLVFAGLFIYRMFMQKKMGAATSGAGSSMGQTGPAPYQQPQPSAFQSQNMAGTSSAPTEPVGGWVIPAGFDVNQFLKEAKQQFLNLQKAFDDVDLPYIENHTTTEMFQQLKMEIDTRLGENVSIFLVLNADLMGVEVTATDAYLASVRFSGMIQESPGAASTRFEEVWNLEKTPSTGWLLAGIQQL